MDEPGLTLVEFATVTPARFDSERLQYAGAVYNQDGLVPQSIRPVLAWNFNEFDGLTVAEPLRLNSAIYLGRFFFHFGHFLLETLPNFVFADTDSLIVMHPWPETLSLAQMNKSHIKTSLEALNIKFERIILANKLIHVDKLLVAPRNEVLIGKPNPYTISVFRKILNHVCINSDVVTPSYIYFSRRQFGGKRYIVDEDWLEGVFAGLGFTIVYPESLSFADQVLMASRARFVAGIDGSALHLCGFMAVPGRCLVIATRPRHKVIEVINELAGVRTDWIDGASLFDSEFQVWRLNHEIVERGVRKWIEDGKS